jgi:hypothetical protein
MILPPKRPQPAKLTPLDKLLAESVYKEIPIAVVQHCEAVPLGVMVRGTMEWLLDEPMMEKLFQQHAPDQYTRELTVSSLVKLFIQVSSGARGSVYAAYKADQATDEPMIETSFQALYGKLGRLQPAVSEAVVRYSAEREAACKTVFTQRIKRSGMRWGNEFGQMIVDLRVIYLSGIWSDVISRELQARPQPQTIEKTGSYKPQTLTMSKKAA